MKNFFGFLFLTVSIIAFLGVYFNWTDSNIEYVASIITHHTVHIPLWLSALAAIIGNGITFIFNIVVEIIKHCH